MSWPDWKNDPNWVVHHYYTSGYGGFPAIDTCIKCGNWRARGMACGFCDRTGQAPCPATAPHEKCVLCKGEEWIEAI